MLASYLAPAENVDFYSACTAARIMAGFSAVNPHAQFTLRHGGMKTVFSHSGEKWEKWDPKRPTSPHWYRTADLQALIGADIHHAGDRGAGTSIRQYVREFHGLTGSTTATAVVAAAGLSSKTLADMVAGDDVDPEKVERLLTAMQSKSREVKPKQLGVVGKAWIESRLVELYGVFAESIRYKSIRDVADGLPFVLEVALGVNTVRNENTVRDDDDGDDYFEIDEEANRKVVVALNWSPTLQVPFDALDGLLQEKRVDRWDEVTLLVHLASPRLNFLDRGKSSLKLPRRIESALANCIRHVAKEHHREKQRADREGRLSAAAYERLRKARQPKKVDLIEAAYGVMEQAYRKVSGPHNAPAGARQIMYAVRPFVLELCGKCWKHSSYFTQTLLPDFMRDNPELTAEWDVVFDARGKLVEPHTRRVVNLGTIGVREYIGGWRNGVSANAANIISADGVQTCGPANRYRFTLFVEKEGFGPHLDYARIAERFDVAIMSTKGMSVTACRRLVEELSEAGVTILVLRDFDAAGFSIVHTLRSDTRRYQFTKTPNVIDLGLRLTDALKMALQDEQVAYRSKVNPRERLARCGATEEEQAFLVSGGAPGHWIGKRIELNAMTTPQFLGFVERKLAEAGAAEKVVPTEKTLDRAYRLLAESHYIGEHSAELLAEAKQHAKAAKLPDDLRERIDRHLAANPAASWDEAVAAIVRQGSAKPSKRRKPR